MQCLTGGAPPFQSMIALYKRFDLVLYPLHNSIQYGNTQGSKLSDPTIQTHLI